MKTEIRKIRIRGIDITFTDFWPSKELSAVQQREKFRYLQNTTVGNGKVTSYYITAPVCVWKNVVVKIGLRSTTDTRHMHSISSKIIGHMSEQQAIHLGEVLRELGREHFKPYRKITI